MSRSIKVWSGSSWEDVGPALPAVTSQFIQLTNPASTGYIIRAAASQTANIFQIQNYGVSPLFTIDNSGNVGINGNTISSRVLTAWGSISSSSSYGSWTMDPIGSTGIAQIDVQGSNAFRINTNGRELVRFDGSANVNFGYTTALSSFSISSYGGWSGANIGKQLYITTPTSGSNPAIGISDYAGINNWAIVNTSNSLAFAIMPALSDNVSAPSYAVVITKTGNLGIGNASPTFGLDVSKYIGSVAYGTNWQGIRLVTGYTRSDTSEYIGRGIAVGVQNYTATLQGTDGSLNNYDLAINPSSGNLIVGQIATPGSRAHFGVTSGFSAGANWGTWAVTIGQTSVSAGTGSGALSLGYDDTLGASIAAVSPGVAWKPLRITGYTIQLGSQGAYNNVVLDNNGYLLIGYTTSVGGYKLQVNGSSYLLNGYSTSDKKYKENIESFDDGLNIVKSLNPVKFDWIQQDHITDKNGNILREKHEFPEGKNIGFIAQDVQETLKDKEWLGNIISSNTREKVLDEDGKIVVEQESYLALSEGKMVAILVSAIKELAAEVEELKKKK